MRLEEGPPRNALGAEWGRIDPVVEEDPFYCAANHMAKVIECAADPRVTPTRVIAGHVQNKRFNFGGRFGAAWFSRGAAIVLVGYELSVPSKQGVRRDDGPKRGELPCSNYLCFGCQASTLAVSNQDAIPSIGSINAVYFAI